MGEKISKKTKQSCQCDIKKRKKHFFLPQLIVNCMGNNPTIFEPLNYYSLPHKNTVENKNFWGREKRNYFSSLKTIPVYIYYITKER